MNSSTRVFSLFGGFHTHGARPYLAQFFSGRVTRFGQRATRKLRRSNCACVVKQTVFTRVARTAASKGVSAEQSRGLLPIFRPSCTRQMDRLDPEKCLGRKLGPLLRFADLPKSVTSSPAERAIHPSPLMNIVF